MSNSIIDIKCCSTVKLETTGISHSSQFDKLGTYNLQSSYQKRPTYKHETRDKYIFHAPAKGKMTLGLWMVGQDIKINRVGFHIRSDHVCPEDVQGDWEFADGVGWKIDSELRLVCVEPELGITYVNTSK